MMKTIVIILVTIAISICFGWYFKKCYIEDEIREQKYQREIEKCDRVIEKNKRLSELVNYNGDDWMKKWEEYMIEQMLFDNLCPV